MTVSDRNMQETHISARLVAGAQVLISDLDISLPAMNVSDLTESPLGCEGHVGMRLVNTFVKDAARF